MGEQNDILKYIKINTKKTNKWKEEKRSSWEVICVNLLGIYEQTKKAWHITNNFSQIFRSHENSTHQIIIKSVEIHCTLTFEHSYVHFWKGNYSLIYFLHQIWLKMTNRPIMVKLQQTAHTLFYPYILWSSNRPYTIGTTS